MLSKLVPVIGNVCESNLGLDEDMADVIAKDVDIIVNSAANTSFDERLFSSTFFFFFFSWTKTLANTCLRWDVNTKFLAGGAS